MKGWRRQGGAETTARHARATGEGSQTPPANTYTGVVRFHQAPEQFTREKNDLPRSILAVQGARGSKYKYE